LKSGKVTAKSGGIGLRITEEIRALSSVWLERFLDMEEVTGSNPVEPTYQYRFFIV
jgi:hypothetical protein